MAKKTPTSNQSPLDAIRKVIGAGPNDIVQYRSRPSERYKHWPEVQDAPVGLAEFSKLFGMTSKQLVALGCGNWDGGLFLFPKEWYEHIPARFPIETINGKIEKFVPGKTDRSVGFGMLAYGVRIGPSLDDEEY